MNSSAKKAFNDQSIKITYFIDIGQFPSLSDT